MSSTDIPNSSSMSQQKLDREKQLVADAALNWVRDGMTLGLGSGTTALHFIRALGERVQSGLKLEAVASSRHSELAAMAAGIAMTTPRKGLRLDLTVDGADEISPNLELLKGRGGALLREKIVVQAARYFLVIGDSSKRVDRLGKTPIPVEVIPFAAPWVADRIAALGGRAVLRTAAAAPEQPYCTDQNNYILDCDFGLLDAPSSVAASLQGIAGVAGHGLFLSCTHAALLAEGDAVFALAPGCSPVPASEFKLPF